MSVNGLLSDALERIEELEESLWRTEQESEKAVCNAAEMIECRDNRIAELENEVSALSEALDFERGYSKQGWISVEDRLPDTGRALAIGNGCESEIVVFLKFVGGGGKFKAKGRDCTELVTHWMPLPEPLKEQGE